MVILVTWRDQLINRSKETHQSINRRAKAINQSTNLINHFESFEASVWVGGKAEGRVWCCRLSGRRWMDGRGWSPAYMTLSKMMTLLSSMPGDMELKDLISGAMYSKWWAPHTGVVRWAQRCKTSTNTWSHRLQVMWSGGIAWFD